MAKHKLPSMQWYPGDWRKDIAVQSLSFHDRGVWFEMLMLMHDSEQRGVLVLNGRAMTDEMIARSIGLDIQTFNQTLTILLTNGVAEREPNSGAIINRRMVRDEEVRKIHAEAGKKGGNPVLVNQKSNQNSTPTDNQNSTPSSSSSTSVNTKTNTPPAAPEKFPSETSTVVDEIYRAYPRREAPREAKKAIVAAIKRIHPDHDPPWLLERTQAYAVKRRGEDQKFTPLPATWFNRGSYDDETLKPKMKDAQRFYQDGTPVTERFV